MSSSRSTLPEAVCLCLCLALLVACAPGSPAGPTPTRTRPADGAVMLHVPAGEFLMGSTGADPKAAGDEKPAHTVYLDGFWIDRTEVTNAQYVLFLNALGSHRAACSSYDCAEIKLEDTDSHLVRRESDGRYVAESGYEDHPAIEVSWYGAQAYCQWAGARLPTEAEWEKAARGPSTGPDDAPLYPWGNARPSCRREQYGDCPGMTLPVGSLPAGSSPYGALDMAGNVWEWVADWYDAAYYAASPGANPPGPDTGIKKTFRGGSWGYFGSFTRAAERGRNSPLSAGFNVGFRCAASERADAG